MRILIANWTCREVGGAETYLSTIAPELRRIGHEVAFLWESDVPANYERIGLPPRSEQWTISEVGRMRALEAVREWYPDLIYVHRLDDPVLEAGILQVAPAVFFAHDHSRTCISGTKTFTFPVAVPCNRRFGWKCLVHYYPRRCGGLNPITMWRLYRLQVERHALLYRYDAIVTASDHMREEYLKYDRRPKVHKIPFPVLHSGLSRNAAKPDCSRFERRRLLFVGRMVALKGGLVLLEALPQVAKAIRLPIRVTFVGAGPEQVAWQAKAANIEADEKRLCIEFAGWLQRDRISALFDNSDLLIVPSLCPESFGVVGVEAASHGVPAAAFAVGGVREWLFDGVNGHLAPGDPPTAAGLAEAIIKCLRDPEEHARLRRGATEVATRFTPAAHATKLLSVFHEVVATAGLAVSVIH